MEKAHKEKSHELSENPLDGRVSQGHPAGVPAKVLFSVRFSIVNNRKSLGHRPVDPCLSRRVSQGHPAGVPRIGFSFTLCAFSFPDFLKRVQRESPKEGVQGPPKHLLHAPWTFAGISAAHSSFPTANPNPEGQERHLDAARQKLPRDNFCRSVAAQLPSPRGQFERGKNVLYCVGEAIWEAF